MVNFFFGWKKLNLFALGKTNLPPLSPLFSIKFFLFSQKKHLCWKTIKKIQAFFSQKVTQFFTFFSTKHFTLKILRFSKYCLKT